MTVAAAFIVENLILGVGRTEAEAFAQGKPKVPMMFGQRPDNHRFMPTTLKAYEQLAMICRSSTEGAELSMCQIREGVICTRVEAKIIDEKEMLTAVVDKNMAQKSEQEQPAPEKNLRL